MSFKLLSQTLGQYLAPLSLLLLAGAIGACSKTPVPEAIPGATEASAVAPGSAAPIALVPQRADPMQGEWQELGQVKTARDFFSLDATSFEHKGQRYVEISRATIGSPWATMVKAMCWYIMRATIWRCRAVR